ncbi:DNA cytosine methyltransferase [Vineibacter terrae]|uniref:DNA cytosine methyltransferase n=1 Tax=Vineibacter terrae TaxID=2586908 RepID=UPI002E33EDFC|nr:DNA cytosine methyltransferase [Vineibacter terrae]HEX2888033.1 DNA cytosine methyltransferase [Vineibacter terrae]
MRPLLVADLFCGAGGLSEAAKRACAALGRPMRLVCVNHWSIAIETHTRMHPEAQHYCSDVALVRPREAVPEGYLDLLMAAPTCTYHSRARGGRPTSDQQRMDPWHVIPWLTELRVKRLLVENVPEFVDWGPVDPKTGRPIARRKGEYFREWVATIERLGYRVQWRFLTCADYGDATTRRRFFLQARSAARSIIWLPQTHSERGSADLFGAGTVSWRPAREIINWNHRGRSIFNRPKPLAATTIQRIYAGAVKLNWPEPFIVVLRQHMDVRSIDLPLPAIAAAGGHIGLAQPILLQANQSRGRHRNIRGVDQPVCTITGTGTDLGLAEPFVLAQGEGGVARAVSEPLPTVPCGGAHALIAPYYGGGSGLSAKSTEEPLDTITAKARFGMVMPITHGSDRSNRARDVSVPLPTLTTAKRGELAFISASFGEREGQAPRLHLLDKPVPTILAGGHTNLVEPAADGPVYDILYRMLQPDELAAATSLEGYQFAGTQEQVYRQIGNAVPARTGTSLVLSMFHDLQAVPAAPLAVAAE